MTEAKEPPFSGGSKLAKSGVGAPDEPWTTLPARWEQEKGVSQCGI